VEASRKQCKKRTHITLRLDRKRLRQPFLCQCTN